MVYLLYFNYIHNHKFPHEILNLEKGERDMIFAFSKYAIENGDTRIQVKNFGGRKEKE